MGENLAHGCHAPQCGHLPQTYVGPLWWVIVMMFLLLGIAWLFWPTHWDGSNENHEPDPEEHHPYQFDDHERLVGRK